jgi:hypothetical protein
VPASTVHRVLVRHGMNRLAWTDRPTERVIRRIHTDRPGALVHVDLEKLGRIPDGGGWRVHGRAAVHVGRDQRSRGMSYVHSAIDAHSRLAFSEIHKDERGPTCSGLFARPERSSRSRHQVHRRCADRQRQGLPEPRLPGRARGRRAPSDPVLHAPRTNGKVERFNRTWSSPGSPDTSDVWRPTPRASAWAVALNDETLPELLSHVDTQADLV